MNQKKKLHPALASLIVIALIGIVASAAIVINAANNNDTANETTHDHSDHDHADHHSHDTTESTATSESTDTSQYENGTYSATGSYLTPGGRQSIELTVTIADGVITNTSVKNNASDAESREHQILFSDNYKSLVVGKKVGEVSLSRVSGSSLTSSGFNNALNQIKDDARV